MHKVKVTGEGYVIDMDNVKYLTGTTSKIADNPATWNRNMRRTTD